MAIKGADFPCSKQQLMQKYGDKQVEITKGNPQKLRDILQGIPDETFNSPVDLEKAVADNAAKYTKLGGSNAALVSTDPKTGQILAMVGSRDFFNQDIDGNVNVTTMDRQPGSSFKPYAYVSTWKQDNWGPGSTVYDFKTDFGGGYIPSNYDGKDHGVQSMRTALDGSLNIPAVKALYIAGMDETLKTVHDMGITTLNDPSKYGLSLVLGAGEVKPIEHVAAFGVFANGGVKQDQSWFIKIEDSKGKTMEEYKQKPGKQVLDPQLAYLMSNVLSDNNARSYIFGSRNSLTMPDRPVAAKTGTTNDYRDAWTVGYTPQIATAVWVGNNDGKLMSKGADGSVVAAPIFQQYMIAAHKGMGVEQFAKPSGIKTVTLDAMTGRQVTSATKQTRTDVFPSWYKTPAAVNGQNQEVKVDKLTGKLVNNSCPPPADAIQTLTYSPITAEISAKDPAYSRWNAPVQAWAKSAGLSTDGGGIPTETDDCAVFNSSNKPKVDIISPDGNNPKVSSPFAARATASTPNGFESLIFTVNGQSFNATANGAYYEAQITLPKGTYTITATIKDKYLQTATATQQVTVN
jgi:membrane peptidoglycan carboxypeptidase